MAGFNKASTKKLFAAVLKNNAKAIPGLVEGGADPNAQTKDHALGFVGPAGATPLTLAALNSRPPVIAALVRAGADPNLAATGPGMTPLMACGFNGANLKQLLSLGADPDVTSGRRQETALHYFMEWSMESNCAELIKAGADPSVPNKAGMSATEFALERGYDELHALFIKAQRKGKKTSTSGPSEDEFTVALMEGTAAQVKKLLQAGCDANTELSGVPPLHICVRHDNVATAKALLEAGADATAVSLADCDLESEMVGLLLDHGADPNANYAAISLLMHAIEKNHIEAVKRLVQAGAKTRTKDARHEIAVAEMSGHLAILEFLSDRFTDPAKLKPSKAIESARQRVAELTGIEPVMKGSLPVRYRCDVDDSVLTGEEKALHPGASKAARSRRRDLAAEKVVRQLFGTLQKCELYDDGELVLIEKKNRWHLVASDRKTVAWLKELESAAPFFLLSFQGGQLICEFETQPASSDIKSFRSKFPKSDDGAILQRCSTKGFSINFDV